MNERISWESSLVKKFSSSNHYKLLNQLRTEVKKYPLNYKKNKSQTLNNDNKLDKKNNSNFANSQDLSLIKNSNINNEKYTNQSSVSFNNSKNFSIYNNTNDVTPSQKKDNITTDENNYSVDSSSSTFKDRLNQIDMK